MGYEGTVDEIFPEKGIVSVLATVFGRQTQIDIEYWMIEKSRLTFGSLKDQNT